MRGGFLLNMFQIVTFKNNMQKREEIYERSNI